ncbi:MAG: extracellular solute-binding protein [Clostridia bacterium]|nr:extracellular solute-binding protein [Clostridia bacterium]
MKASNLISLSLISALILTSCGSDTQTPPDSGTDAPGTTTDETTALTDGLEGYNFDGRTFTIVYSADQLGASWPYDADEENGDVLNDSVYARNTAVEDRFNVEIEYYSTGGTNNEVPSAFLNSITAGDNAYQLAISHTFNMIPALITVGALADFNEIPNVDLDKPWWNASIRDNLEILGILPIAVSDLIYSYADVIYVNRDMLEEFKLEDTYDLVYDGKWTWTKLAEMAKAVAGDLDGDGEYKMDDRFGFTLPGETASLMSRIIQSNGMMMATVEDNGLLQLLTVTERLQNTLERYYDLIYNDNKTYFGSITDKATSVEIFSQGNVLFMHQTTLQLPTLRDVDVNFGIVPLPKYDEDQEDYMSMLSSQILLVPNTTEEELTFIGTIAEALSYESWSRVTPAVYESIFESKYLRDATSYEMYQSICDSLVCDFNWNYGAGNKLFQLPMELIKGQKSTDAASYLAQYSESIMAEYETLFDAVRDVYGVE